MMCNDLGMSTLEEAHFGVMLSGVYASSQHDTFKLCRTN